MVRARRRNLCKLTKIVKPVKRSERKCAHCGSKEYVYTCPMLKDSVWESIAGKRDLLHFECAETLLNREITIDDLNTAPINYGFHKIWERHKNG